MRNLATGGATPGRHTHTLRGSSGEEYGLSDRTRTIGSRERTRASFSLPSGLFESVRFTFDLLQVLVFLSLVLIFTGGFGIGQTIREKTAERPN